MPTELKCATCNEMFEVSTEIADAMHRWRAQSGEPFTCGECAGVDEIYIPDQVLAELYIQEKNQKQEEQC